MPCLSISIQHHTSRQGSVSMISCLFCHSFYYFFLYFFFFVICGTWQTDTEINLSVFGFCEASRQHFISLLADFISKPPLQFHLWSLSLMHVHLLVWSVNTNGSENPPHQTTHSTSCSNFLISLPLHSHTPHWHTAKDVEHMNYLCTIGVRFTVRKTITRLSSARHSYFNNCLLAYTYVVRMERFIRVFTWWPDYILHK